MKTHNGSCPVCDNQIRDVALEFCPKCNWEIIIISKTASEKLQRFYDEKIIRHRAMFEQNNNLSKELVSKSKDIERLEILLDEVGSKNKRLSSELANQKPVLDKIKQLETETKVKEKQIKELIEDKNKLQARIKTLETNDKKI